MLEFLEGKASGRKFCLFAVACCRRIGHLLAEESSQEVLAVAEQYTDDLVSRQALHELAMRLPPPQQRHPAAINKAREAVWQVAQIPGGFFELTAPLTAVRVRRGFSTVPSQGMSWRAVWASDAVQDALAAETEARQLAGGALLSAASAAYARTWQDERAVHCAFVRDIFGHHFHPVSMSSLWLTWNDGTVAKMAQTIYEERRFTDLPILADALEEAGCTEPSILDHCRRPGEHVRGCWVLDLLLDKQ
jgi:hypothetical protein